MTCKCFNSSSFIIDKCFIIWNKSMSDNPRSMSLIKIITEDSEIRNNT